MGALPSKSIDDRSFLNYDSSFLKFIKKRNKLRTSLKRKKRSISLATSSTTTIAVTKPLCSNNHLQNTNQLPKKSTDNETFTCNNNSSSSSKSKRVTIDSRLIDIGKSTISSDCWTTLSNDPFSQIEVNTSAFTEITDQSTISRKSFFPVMEIPYINQQLDMIDITTQDILHKLNSHPASIHIILNQVYHRARELNDVNDWTEFYCALDQYIKQPTAPQLSKNSAMVYLAQCFIFGFGTDKNIEYGLHLLANHPSCETTFTLGKFYLDGIDSRYINKSKAFECIRSASGYTIMNDSMRATVSEAQCTLARMLFQGEGVAQNPSQALNFLMKSAENDNMYAQFLMGVHFEKGFEIEQNLEKAKSYYRKSASSGFPDAQAALGSRLIAESNYSQGVEWLEKAVLKGNSRAHVQLGILYDKGQGVPQNNDMALLHYKVATENNNPAAQYILGLVYYFGRLGRQKNYKDAIRLIKQSAMAGLPFAQRVLGQLYQQGNIMTDNRHREAIRWFRRAASNSDIAALGILGKCFEVGKGAEMDLLKALAYYAKAAETNSPYLCNAYIDQARILQKLSRHREAFIVYNKVLINRNTTRDNRTIQTAECSIARYHLCRDIEGIEYNPTLAYTMLLKLTETSNDPFAHYWLGSIYDEGIPGVVEVDRQKAYHHFVIAAEAGDNDATFLVAYMLSNYVIPEKGPPDAFPLYKKAAINGHPMSMYSLGLCYYKGIGQKNLDLALEWFEKAVKHGVKDAVTYIARTHLKQATLHSPDSQLAQQFFVKAVAALKIAVENNDTWSQRELGKIYLTGKGVTVNYSLAVELLGKAATKDDPEALTYLGDCYQKGVGVERNLDIAIEHYVRAAELGYPYAYSAAADLYYKEDDLMQAYEFYTLASQDPRIADTKVGKTARMMVARLALDELPVVPSIDQQFKETINANTAFETLFTLATQDDFIPAFQPLGTCYLYGNGTEINLDQALFWLQKSAQEHNDSAAFFHLAHLADNNTEALEHLTKSGDMGYTKAQFKLGMVYLHGEYGVCKDEQKAISWFQRASSTSKLTSKLVASLGHDLAMPNAEAAAAFDTNASQDHVHNSEKVCTKNGISTTRNDHHAAKVYYRVGLMHADKRRDIEAFICFYLATTVDNHGPSYYRLGLYYLNGISNNLVTPITRLSIEYFQKAADLNVPRAMLQLGLLLEEQGLEYLYRAADMGLSEAQFRLGLYFHRQNDNVKAYDLFRRSSSQKHPAATYYLGIYHHYGIYVSQDFNIALEQYELAVELFETLPDRWMAEYNLARILHCVGNNQMRAYEVFQNAHAHSPEEFKVLMKIMITKYHLYGWGGVEVHAEQAVNALFEFAKDERFGHLVYLEIAQCFENGIGVARSLRQAFHWYGEVINNNRGDVQDIPIVFLDKEIEQDQGTAMFKLGEFYRNGIVAKQDLKKADDLCRLAAKKGCVAAQQYICYN